MARCDGGIALILIEESTKHVIKLAIHLGNPGSNRFAALRVKSPSEIVVITRPRRSALKLCDMPISLRIKQKTESQILQSVNPQNDSGFPKPALGVLIVIEPRILVWALALVFVLLGLMMLMMSSFIRKMGARF